MAGNSLRKPELPVEDPRMPATAYLNLVATHLNAPYGAVVRPQDVAAAFRT